jgi:chromosome condensin MukBEF MukE localization factor
MVKFGNHKPMADASQLDTYFIAILRRWRAGVHVSDDELQYLVEFYRDFCTALEAMGLAYKQTLMLASSEYQQALKVAQARKRHKEVKYAEATAPSVPLASEVHCG